jgi:lysophospholipase L1-like esterase
MKDYLITDRVVLRVHSILQKSLPQNMDYDAFEHEMTRTATRYRENMRAVIGLAKSKAIPVILIKQPMTTRHNRYISFSYEEEYNAILVRFSEKKYPTPNELQLIQHHHLIKELEKIAEEENLPMVDNIAIVDQDRRRLASWVHLTEEGNLRLAEALKSVIEPYIEQRFAVSGWYDLLPHLHQDEQGYAKARR